MGLEVATKIAELNELWPLGTDLRSQGDDHIRQVKAVLQADVVSKIDGGAFGADIAIEHAGPAGIDFNAVGAVQLARISGTATGAFLTVWDTGTLEGELALLHGSIEARLEGAGSQDVSARIEAAGAGVTDGLTVLTKEKADPLYLGLGGGELTGQILAPSADTAVAPSYTWVGQDVKAGLFLVADNTPGFAVSSVEAARVEPAGASVTHAKAILTKEKGDALYSSGIQSSSMIINGTNGATQFTDGMTCVRNSAGNYTFTLDTPRATNAFIPILTPHNGTARHATVASRTVSEIVVLVYNDAGAASDCTSLFIKVDQLD